MRTAAEMLASAKGEMIVRLALEIEGMRTRERCFVAIAGRKPERRTITRADLLAAQLGVCGCDASEVSRRAGPAQNFLDRGRHDLRIVEKKIRLIGMFMQGQQSGCRAIQSSAYSGLPMRRQSNGFGSPTDCRFSSSLSQSRAVPKLPSRSHSFCGVSRLPDG